MWPLRQECRCGINGVISTLSKPPSLPSWQVLKGHLFCKLAAVLPIVSQGGTVSPQVSKIIRTGRRSSPSPSHSCLPFPGGSPATDQSRGDMKRQREPQILPIPALLRGKAVYSEIKGGKLNLKQKKAHTPVSDTP